MRISRTCRAMDVRSIAVYSDADRDALHVRACDEAVRIGPAPARESYLDFERVLAAARETRADAIHPGYGFLSENADFAQACIDEGLVFVGPTPAAMRAVGDKVAAKRSADEVGVPTVPGYLGDDQHVEALAEHARRIGAPLLVKAAAGGGGKGMRAVKAAADLRSAYDAARSEAQRSFGDNEVYIERLIVNPRHVEMQIFGDEHGNVVYLGERECSIQRRHQKVMEEAPSPIVDDDMRRRMGEVAVRVGTAANYYNAGTVEFLVDAERNFFFLEMNTRLQVEHPVTEFITGLDLVHLQMRVAAGEKLPVTQDEIKLRGHAIECRVYAEDPDNSYFPSPGQITRLISPSGPGIRRDSGMYEGWTVPIEYDPLLAKLVVYGENRDQAIQRLQRALTEYFVGGIKTNVSLFRRILQDPDFRAARLDTGYLDRLLAKPYAETDKNLPLMAAIAAGIFATIDPQETFPGANGLPAPAGGEANGKVEASNWRRMARREALQ